MSGPVHLVREGRAVFRGFRGSFGREMHTPLWESAGALGHGQGPGVWAGTDTDHGLRCGGMGGQPAFNLTPKCQYICRSFLCGGAFILSRKGSSDLLPSVGLGVGA